MPPLLVIRAGGFGRGMTLPGGHFVFVACESSSSGLGPCDISELGFLAEVDFV